jgi:hypothetical protein
MLDTMTDSLSDVLAENEIATQAEWEKKSNEKSICEMIEG